MTTITQPWTITSAFATIFNEILGRTEQYKKSIEDIAKATGATFAALFDKHGIPVVQNAKGKVQDDIVNLAAPYFFKIKEILGQIKSGTTDKIAIEWDNYEFLVLAIPEPIPLTLLVVGITGKIDKNAAPGIVRPIIKTMF